MCHSHDKEVTGLSVHLDSKKLILLDWQSMSYDAQGANELFKSVEFAPYDPTQDVIFPPELMVSLHILVVRLWFSDSKPSWNLGWAIWVHAISWDDLWEKSLKILDDPGSFHINLN